MADSSMSAVVRVRGVREQDSRLGLSTALREQQAAEQLLEERREQVRQTPAFASGSGADLVRMRSMLGAMCSSLSEREQALENSRAVAAAARARWMDDKTRLSAVELLVERRAEQARAERARREAGELDDVAARLWLHQRRAGEQR